MMLVTSKIETHAPVVCPTEKRVLLCSPTGRINADEGAMTALCIEAYVPNTLVYDFQAMSARRCGILYEV